MIFPRDSFREILENIEVDEDRRAIPKEISKDGIQVNATDSGMLRTR